MGYVRVNIINIKRPCGLRDAGQRGLVVEAMDIEREILAEEVALQGPLDAEFPHVVLVDVLRPGGAEVVLKIDFERQRLSC